MILKSHFKHLNNSKLSSLYKAITCVALGLRVSHLVDVSHLDLKAASNLINDLKKDSLFKSLILIQFKDRYTFLCNKNRLKQHLNIPLNQWIYISVEGNQPIKSDEPPIHLLNYLKDFNISKSIIYFDIVPPFMVALTGWFLEYPVIYTTHLITDDPYLELDEWEPRSNCLGNQVLKLTQVWLDDHMLFSFSFPILTLSDLDYTSFLKNKINQRLSDCSVLPEWLKNIHTCTIRSEQVKLDRFAL